MSHEPDYITVNPAVRHGFYNVVHMKWVNDGDGYVVYRASEQLRHPAAESLAKSWAAAMGLEIR